MGKLSEQCCQTTLVNVAINRQPGEAQGATMHKKKTFSRKNCSRKFPVYLQPKYVHSSNENGEIRQKEQP